MTYELSNYDFDPFFNLFAPDERKNGYRQSISMKTDVKEDEANYIMDVELPGVKKEDIGVSLKDGYLTITAKRESEIDENKANGKYIRHERTFGSATRAFYVGLTDEKGIMAKFADGILTLTFPKEEEKKEITHKVEIK